jgi:hypothetical protein
VQLRLMMAKVDAQQQQHEIDKKAREGWRHFK